MPDGDTVRLTCRRSDAVPAGRELVVAELQERMHSPACDWVQTLSI